ncbi:MULTISPECIES: hypothetical protein [unclassified Mycoplasma]|uniref:hypothetical protein n=1 Tax=unclassified Mycoplasma TaxID=2683645 RepID=UPI00211C07E6|nr:MULTISPECIES: hypothetical protein [unclassified Mycoplasma]UUM19873.1 hypothetical protein NPA11_00320 [Mycoplasma sp. 1578d]UUM24857.1 hypothetical protein NPA12_00320 [Mycoplasma sp. 3686d]
MGIHLGFKGAIFGGLFLGFCSFFGAMTFGSILFIYPLISILPRFVLGFIVYWLCYQARKMIDYASKKRKKNLWVIKLTCYFLVGALSALANTVFVTFGLFLHKLIFGLESIGSFEIWIGLIWIQAIFELLSIGLLCLIMSSFLYSLSSRKISFYSQKIKW